MKKEEEKYYGIRFNDDIPKLNEINEYSKEVELKFMGKAFFVIRDDDNKVIERVPIDNYYKIKEEGTYEIEYIDLRERTYHLQVRIEKSCLFFILLIFLGILLLSLCFNPLKDGKIFQNFFKAIDFSVIELDIDKNEKINYVFDVDFENTVSKDVELSNTVDSKALAKNKVAPGISGEFSIIINTKGSNVDMHYSVNFEDITNEKPYNLLFKIKGTDKEYSSLQELETVLKGIVKKQTETKIDIEWRWPYEIDNGQDLIDTKDGINLENYKFKINVTGQEVI